MDQETAERRSLQVGIGSLGIGWRCCSGRSGSVGSSTSGWPAARIALVDHRGAKTGAARTSPLMFHRDGEMIGWSPRRVDSRRTQRGFTT